VCFFTQFFRFQFFFNLACSFISNFQFSTVWAPTKITLCLPLSLSLYLSLNRFFFIYSRISGFLLSPCFMSDKALKMLLSHLKKTLAKENLISEANIHAPKQRIGFTLLHYCYYHTLCFCLRRTHFRMNFLSLERLKSEFRNRNRTTTMR